MRKILLDTDIGSDIDDAVCLAYLLAQPSCQLLGITTVSGQPVLRARLASALCHRAGQSSIPIYPGAARPLKIEQTQKEAAQAAALASWPHQKRFKQDQALRFMRDTIRASPGEVTLLAIGPLTNVASLFIHDPEIPSLLDALVLMCGVFTRPGEREWNALLDPQATDIVYRSRPPRHISIGLDVTQQVQMPAVSVHHAFKAPLLQPVLDWAEIWFRGRSTITFHDPLAAVTLFEEDVCRFQSGVVTVGLENSHSQGETIWQSESGHGPHQVAVEVDPARFFERFFGVFGPSYRPPWT